MCSFAVCGRHYVENNGVITSPNYPNDYPHGRDCEYTITVETGHQIHLNITDFSLEHHHTCNYDYLEIR